MIKAHFVIILLASVFTSIMIRLSQVGEWEVPPAIINQCNVFLIIASILVSFAIIFFVVSIKEYTDLRKILNIVFIIWVLIIIAILLFGWSGKIYNWSL